MSETSRHLLEQAIKLSVTERAQLATELLVSLHGEPEPDAEAAWAAEVERRALSDDSSDRDWAVVRAEMATKYGFK